jgi:hypothetical protein
MVRACRTVTPAVQTIQFGDVDGQRPIVTVPERARTFR